MLIRLMIKNTMRQKLRTILTILGMAVAASSFLFLRTVITSWNAGVEASSANRLVTRNKVSIIFSLPLAYRDKIAAIPGVSHVTYGNWFGAIYKDEKNFFPQFAVDPETHWNVYPEFTVSEAGREALRSERNACIVGKKLAERFGWNLGDEIRLIGTIFPGDWDFVIRGIYTANDGKADETQFFFNWNYIDQSPQVRDTGSSGKVGFYTMRIAHPDDAAKICDQVDKLFNNSANETLTETEAAFAASFVAMSGAIIKALELVSYVVILIIMLVLVNTMSMSARERTGEYAVLKTLGYRSGFLVKLIAGESILLSVLGGLLGFALANFLVGFAGKNLANIFPKFVIAQNTLVIAAIATLIVGMIAAAGPAIRASKINIVDGLRQVV